MLIIMPRIIKYFLKYLSKMIETGFEPAPEDYRLKVAP